MHHHRMISEADEFELVVPTYIGCVSSIYPTLRCHRGPVYSPVGQLVTAPDKNLEGSGFKSQLDPGTFSLPNSLLNRLFIVQRIVSYAYFENYTGGYSPRYLPGGKGQGRHKQECDMCYNSLCHWSCRVGHCYSFCLLLTLF